MKMPLVVFLAFLSLCGCTTLKMASNAQDADAKEFHPPQGKANLYVIRRTAAWDNFTLYQLSIDGRPLGQLATDTYQMASLSPGDHTLEIRGNDLVTTVKITAEADKNTFYQTELKRGTSGAQLEVSPVLFEEIGRSLVTRANRIQTPE